MAHGGLSLQGVAGSGRDTARTIVLGMANTRLYIAPNVQTLLVDLHTHWRATLGPMEYDVRATLDNDRDPPPFPSAAELIVVLVGGSGGRGPGEAPRESHETDAEAGRRDHLLQEIRGSKGRGHGRSRQGHQAVWRSRSTLISDIGTRNKGKRPTQRGAGLRTRSEGGGKPVSLSTQSGRETGRLRRKGTAARKRRRFHSPAKAGERGKRRAPRGGGAPRRRAGPRGRGRDERVRGREGGDKGRRNN